MMTPEQANADDRKWVILEGALTINSVEKIKDFFVESLKDANEVCLAFGEITEVDLSCLQLLCSVHRSAAREHKHMHFEGSFPQILKDAAEAAGFFRLTGCKINCGNSCFWTPVTGARHG